MFGTIIVGFLINMLLSVIIYATIDCSNGKYSLNKYEEKGAGWLCFFGFPYWTLKFITYPVFIVHYRKKRTEKKLKKLNELLIESVCYKYPNAEEILDTMSERISSLKSSVSQDLYSRAVDSHNDMLRILIRCSNGEGDLDFNRFEDVIKGAINECSKIARLAYVENNKRTKEAEEIYYKDKKVSIEKDLEDMKNKNVEFINMWDK